MPASITMGPEGLRVPDEPIVPFIEGDGTGPDIWAAAVRVFDAAVARAYGGRRRLAWKEVLAGEKAFGETGEWLPEATLDAFREHLVGIKGPLTTPVGGGIRSLNVAVRQMLDLYACVRPVRWYQGVPSPVCHPERVDMVIFRENTEDVYAGMEVEAGSEEARRLIEYLRGRVRLGDPLRQRRRHQADLEEGHPAPGAGRRRATPSPGPPLGDPGAQGQHHEVHRGRLPDLGLPSGRGGVRRAHGVAGRTAAGTPATRLLIKDSIADAFLQQILTRPEEYDVIATMNLNGDYISDALAAQVGGIGIAPGGNINYDTGHAVFEATHGTAPKYAGQDKVNPGSVILSGVMMLRYLGWGEAADAIEAALEATIAAEVVTYDFARLMEGATEVPTSEFASAIIDRL